MQSRLAVLSLTLWSALASAPLAETRITVRTPGASETLSNALRSASLALAAGKEAQTQDMLAAAQADYARLLGVLYEHARYGGVITIRVNGQEAATIPPLSPPNEITNVDITVTAGPVYRFSTATIQPLAPQTELPASFIPGAEAHTTTIREAATNAIEAWRTSGHAKAQVSRQSITAQHANTTVAAQLSIKPGPRLRFGPPQVTGATTITNKRILEIAGLPTGETFDPAEVARVGTRLRRTGAFSAVTVTEADEIGPDNTLPIEIEVIDAMPRRFGFGAEYSTVEGVALSGFWLHRNFLGGAERFRVDGEVAGLAGETGGVDSSLGIRFEQPAQPRADVDLFSELTFENLKEPDYTSKSAEFTLGYTRYATDELTVNFGLGYVFADIEDAFGTETYHLATLPLAAELDRRDDPLNPTDGTYINLGLTPYLGLNGTSGGTRLTLDTRGYHSTETLTYAARLQLGALFGPSFTDAPSIYRFFSGGGGTVRGQDYESLSIDVGGESVGGRSFLGFSGELRKSITDEIQVVGFADWGYVGVESFPNLSGDSHSGAGLGLRYNTGIGPIRLDLATPLTNRDDANSLYLYVGIGQAF